MTNDYNHLEHSEGMSVKPEINAVSRIRYVSNKKAGLIKTFPEHEKELSEGLYYWKIKSLAYAHYLYMTYHKAFEIKNRNMELNRTFEELLKLIKRKRFDKRKW